MSTTSFPAFRPPPLDARIEKFLGDYPPELFSERLYRSIELMERYSIDLAIDLLDRLQVFAQLEQWRTAVELCQRLDFQPRFSSALGWLLQRLIESGCVESRGDAGGQSYHLRDSPWQPELTGLREIGLEIDRGNAPTLDLLEYAASLYPAVARGELSGEQALFEPRGVSLWLSYFHNDNPTYAINNWLGAQLAAERLRAHSRFRILELGAGGGSATEILLRCLDEQGLLRRMERYVITEPNAFFRRRNQRDLSQRYRELPLEWSGLDIDVPWETQTFSRGEFDLVYGVNVLHVARDLLFGLGQARNALANEGWLVIGECVRPFAGQPIYAELVFQILDSFTQVNTHPEFRPNPGFLTTHNWRFAFALAGFQQVQIKPDLDSISKVYPHFFSGAICGQTCDGG